MYLMHAVVNGASCTQASLRAEAILEARLGNYGHAQSLTHFEIVSWPATKQAPWPRRTTFERQRKGQHSSLAGILR